MTTSPDHAVLGYCTVAGQAWRPGCDRRRPPWAVLDFPSPVALPAGLAVAISHQGQGVGAALLRDALSRIQLASEQVAVRAVIVHAVDHRAATFYERFGFRALTTTARTLMVTLGDLRCAGD